MLFAQNLVKATSLLIIGDIWAGKILLLFAFLSSSKTQKQWSNRKTILMTNQGENFMVYSGLIYGCE